MVEDWIGTLAAELGVDIDIDTGLLLEVSREAAHSIARPAAPMTTFLIGYAAAAAGGGPQAVVTATDTARDLAQRWQGSGQ
jgi:hypothetical protein